MGPKDSISASASFKVVKAIVDVSWIVGWIYLALIAISFQVFVMSGASIFPGANDLEIPAKVNNLSVEYQRTQTHQLSDEIEVKGYKYYVIIATSTWQLRLLSSIPHVFYTLAILWVAHHLRKFLKNIQKNKTFDQDSSFRIRAIGYSILILSPAIGIVNFLTSFVLIPVIDSSLPIIAPFSDFGYGVTVKLEYVFTGLIIILIAHIIDFGARIQQEQELTI